MKKGSGVFLLDFTAAIRFSDGIMPRRRRFAMGGYVYHVLNRAVGRGTLFRNEGDYAAFERDAGGGLEPDSDAGALFLHHAQSIGIWCSGRSTTATSPSICGGSR